MKPTRKQVLAEPAGPQLDGWVAELVLGFSPGMMVSPFSSQMGSAWLVFQTACEWLFSRRSLFLSLLEDQATTPSGSVPSGFHKLAVMRDRFPEAICRAALLAVLESLNGKG